MEISFRSGTVEAASGGPFPFADQQISLLANKYQEESSLTAAVRDKRA
jgi:hypothetical protein